MEYPLPGDTYINQSPITSGPYNILADYQRPLHSQSPTPQEEQFTKHIMKVGPATIHPPRNKWPS